MSCRTFIPALLCAFIISACLASTSPNDQSHITPRLVLEIPTIIPTITPIPPTPTRYIITVTIPAIFITPPSPTLVPSTVTVSIEDTKKGNFLHVSRSTDNLQSTLGPIADGIFIVGPNDSFIVYCTNGGSVYAVKLGEQYLKLIGDVSYFSAIQRNAIPKLELHIFFNNGAYKVDVWEHRFGQNEIINLPQSITQ